VTAESAFETFIFRDAPSFSTSNTMATTLGKRKRRTAEVYIDAQRKEYKVSNSLDLDAREIFRRHFEAQFKPLPVLRKAAKVVEEAEEDDSEESSSWNGLSEDEGRGVQVVEHTDAQSRMAAMSKDELKAFMVSLSFSTIILSNKIYRARNPLKEFQQYLPSAIKRALPLETTTLLKQRT
jgi:hypothetical protein